MSQFSLPIVPTLAAVMLFLLGCKSDGGKQDVGLSAPSSVHSNSSSTSSNSLAQPASTIPSPAPPLPASSQGTEPIIVCFGDSLTAGLGIDPGETYPDDLQHRLDAEGFHYRVVNAGISGETTKDGLDRIARVIARHPELVVVEFGGNDGLRGLPPEDTERNLMTIVGKLQASGARVALAGITLPPQFGGDYIHQFNAMFPAVAGKYKVPLLPFLLQDVYGVDGDIQEDGIHPTAQGAKQVAVNIDKLITPMLHK